MGIKKGNLTLIAVSLVMLFSYIGVFSLTNLGNVINLHSASLVRVQNFYNVKNGLVRLVAISNNDIYYLSNHTSGDIGVQDFSYSVTNVLIEEPEDEEDELFIEYSILVDSLNYTLTIKYDNSTSLTEATLL